ncbi:hypothetical protein [Saccharicrinis aurantiacus]|uniref:hypothetical protein n=1 Tax=Saccharicrinis aurantiacus TaxID=1849719 RepID=UPI00094FE67B|nr:hypothetical protein [Saccharicrinis aurantiacus]
MDIAYNTVIKRLVASEELWELEVVEKDIYSCPDCYVPLAPASYLRTNKKRPYFRYLKPHKIDCAYSENSSLIKTAQSKSISNKDGFPFPYPSKLIFENKNNQEAINNDTDVPRANRSKKKSNEYGSGKTNHHRTVSTIKNIVRHYVCFPNDRHVGLTVPYVSSEQTTYNSIFKNIWGGVLYSTNHIFFSKIYWTSPEITEEHISIRLTAGEWEDGKQTKPCKLRININSLSSRQRALVLRELKTTKLEAMKNKASVNGYIFFLGKQDKNDRFLFHTDSHKLISCLTVLKSAKI